MALDRGTVMLGLLAVFAAGVVLALGVVLVRERRSFVREGKGRAWAFVRLGSLPLLLATVAVVVLPARAISGMEALAVFYGALFTAAPLVWFGGHWLLGRAARPALSSAESLRLSATLPAFLIGAAMLAQALQPLAWSVAVAAESARYRMANDAEPRHEVAASRRWTTPAGDVVLVRWQAPDDVAVERIDVRAGAYVFENAGRTLLHRLCQAPGTIVIVQPASEPMPTLRVYWHDPADRRLRASTLPTPPPADPTPFEIAWHDETGFTLPEPLPRQAIYLARESDPAGTFFSTEAQSYLPGEPFERSCLPEGWRARAPLRGLRVRVDGLAAPGPLWLEAVRPVRPADRSSSPDV
ncbi:hypothetical protein K2Z84_04170, partial [Candidatus Binatia bacterium]|nr:hypothetical protein [Candidatus Binatia bacterium]